MVSKKLVRTLLPLPLIALVLGLAPPPATAGSATQTTASMSASQLRDALSTAAATATAPVAAAPVAAIPATSLPRGSTAPTPGGALVDLTSGLDGEAAAPPPASSASDPPSGVDSAARETVAADGSAPVIVRLRDQVDTAQLAQQAAQADRAATAAAARELQGSASAVTRQAREAGRAARGTLVVDTLQATAAASQPAVRQLLADHQASDVTGYWIFNGLSATVDAAALDALAAHPDVASVTLDQTILLDEPDFEPGEPLLPVWSLERVNATDAWGEYGVRGDGVVVGVLDSGVDGSHPALAASWRGNTDPDTSWFVATGENYPTPGDGHGHGTHVTGSIVGAPPGEVTGVAPEAQWIGAKIFTDFGSTTDSIITTALEWMLAPGGDPTAAPHVINNSWGSNDGTRTIYWEVFEALVAAGVVPITSNGNAGPNTGTVGSPASYPHVIGVGATDIEDRIASFSSRGPAIWDGVEHTKPQVSAPGHAVFSTLPGGGYGLASGTSMAAPHVAGVVALLLSAAPDLTVDEVREALADSARSAAHMRALPQAYGAGIVDAHAAITYAAHSGTVTGAITGDGQPLAATIVAGERSYTADPDTGEFSLRLPAGSHELRIDAYGYLPQTHQVQLGTGSTVNLDVSLATAGVHTLSGTVTGADGPVPGARVSVLDAPVSGTRTGEDGTFALELAQGTYQVRVAAGGFAPVQQQVIVGDGPADLPVSLEPNVPPAHPGWSQYQNNPARTGLSGDDLAAGSLEEVWSASAGGQIPFASPVIADGRVFVNVDNGRLVAFDLSSGAQLWTFTGSANMRGAPAVAGGVVYTGGGIAGGIHALDAASGDLLWTVDTPQRRTLYTAPVVADGVVYATTGFTANQSDSLLALDAATGDELWSVDLGPRVFFGPAVADGLVVAGSAGTNRLVALDAETGDEVWRLQRDLDEFIAGPSIVDGTIYATTTIPPTVSAPSWEGSLLAVDAATGEVIWEVPTHGDGQGTTPAVHGDLVVAGSHGQSMVAAYDRATGEARWHYGLPINGGVSHSVIISGDGYVVAGSQIDQRVFALDAGTGELVWEQPTGANVLSSAAYAEGRLVTAFSNGTVRVFGPTGQVAGTVTGPDGPVAATVRVVEADRSVQADPDTGAFEVAGLAPGNYTVEVFHYGLSTETRTVQVRAAQTIELEVTLTAVGQGGLAGTITDQTGQPLAGATVTLSPTPLDPVVTAEGGGYAFAEVAEGSYQLTVEAAGYESAQQPVTVPSGDTAQVDVALQQLEIAVVSDYQSMITTQLRDAGWLVDRVTFDQIAGNLDRYQAVVLVGENNDRADADLDRFAQIVADADAAGTSLVFLDQWAFSYGSLRSLSLSTGDPVSVAQSNANRGAVWLEEVVEHPITAALSGSRVPLLASNTDQLWFSDYSGYTLARLGADQAGQLGDGLGYQRRTLDSNHILLPVHAPTPWSAPDSTWEPVMSDLLAGAVAHAAQASYGQVVGQVTDASGAPVAATVEVVDGFEHTTASGDGEYELLLAPGEQVLRFSFLGSETVEVPVTVTAGEVLTQDVPLPTAPQGTVAGQVTEESAGTPVSGVTVTLSGLPPVTTGADGRYAITDVPAGGYDISFEATGWESLTITDITVVDGEVTTVDAELNRAPAVVVVGDHNDGISDFLESHSVPVTQAGWEVVDDLDGVEVVVLHNPSNVGQEEFLAALAAFDEAGVSVIFPADGWATRTRGFDLLVNHTGSPPEYARLGGVSGPPIFLHNLADHPLFDGVGDSDPLQLLTNTSEAAYFPSYQGIPLAEVGAGDNDPAGLGMAYDVRTPGSVHLLLTGLASTFRNDPASSWTPDGARIFLNAIRWASSPGQGGLAGVVTDSDGQPVADVVVEVDGSHWRAVTGDDGAFEIGVPPGEHTVQFRGFGYQSATQDFTVAADQIVDASVTLQVAEVGGISGVVTSSDDGGPLEGVRVALRGTPRQTHTAADGSYAIELVEPGSYELELEVDEHVRTLAPVTVSAGGPTSRDVVLRSSPLVGIIDDSDFTNSRDRGKDFLADWGYQAEDISFDSLDRLGGLDLVVANVSDFSLDITREQLQAFEEEVNRAGVPVLWLGQHNRGAIQFLHEHDNDPAVVGEGFNDGAVTADVVQSHPLVAGLPDEFSLMVDGGRYTYFDEFDGTTVARLVTGDDGDLGATIAYRGRTTGTVDVLLSTMTVTTWGAPSTREAPALNWTPESERVLVNALEWALDAQGIGAQVLGTVHSDAGGTLASEVEVVETGRVYTGRAGDGTFLVPLQPGSWTLSVSAFGHDPATLEVTVAAGDALTQPVTLAAHPTGSVAGSITGPDGQPVPGARVELLDTPLAAEAGGSGGYQLDVVPAGDWTLRVTAEGFRAVQRPVSVTAGQATPVNVQLPATSAIAIVDTTGSSVHGLSLSALIEGEGYEVDLVGRANLAELTADEYELIIFNAPILAAQVDAFQDVVDAAAAAGVSTIYGSQFGANHPIGRLSEWRGDPEGVDWGFVSGGIGVDYVAHASHPIFAGFPTGEPIELITSTLSNLNQQWGSFSGYGGETIGHVHNRLTGDDLGAAVGYQFSSPTSVEVLLASLTATTHGWPDSRWTDNARTIYLNAVAWALDATQAELTGVITGDGAPLAGATVTALEAGVTDVTGADGVYTLGLAAGSYTVQVSAFGYATAQETVEVSDSGSVTLDVDLVRLPRGSVAGTVTSTTGEAVAGAQVSGTGPLEWSATTGDGGDYLADDLLEGDYQVSVTADGYLPAVATVTVTAGEQATLDVTLQPTDVGVLGDIEGVLTAYLRDAGVPATSLDWDAGLDLSSYAVLVVNGGDPDEATFQAVLAAADAAQTSLVFTGTWAVDRGGIRLLERYTDRVEVGAQGYGDGPVQLTGFDTVDCPPLLEDCEPVHPLFAGLGDDPVTLIVEGGYYSVLADYAGGYAPEELAQLRVDRDGDDPVTGLAVATDWRTAGSVEVLLSASAVTEAVGPGLGWTVEGGRLLRNAIAWARDAELSPPAAPTLVAEAPVVSGESVSVSGTAAWPSQVTVSRDGVAVATVDTGADGTWSAQVPLLVGDNTLTAVASNLAGDSPASAAVTVSRWEASWQVTGRSPAWTVRLSLAGTPPVSAPADQATLVVRDAGGDVVAEVDMRWAGMFYLQQVRGLPPGDYQLHAELEVDGHVVVFDGPALT